jgi:hypothetical protein
MPGLRPLIVLSVVMLAAVSPASGWAEEPTTEQEIIPRAPSEAEAPAYPEPSPQAPEIWYPFSLLRGPFSVQNCGTTRIEGYIYDRFEEPLQGYYVLIGSIPGPWTALSAPTNERGFFSVGIANGAKAGRWFAMIVGEGLVQLSPRVEVETTEWGCVRGEGGNQTPVMAFISYGDPPEKAYVTRVPPLQGIDGNEDFWIEYNWGEPSCQMTRVEGVIRDRHDNGMSGRTVKVRAEPGPWSAVSAITKDDGRYDFLLDYAPKAGKWIVYIIGVDDLQLSPFAEVETSADCGPDGGNQIIHVEFRERWAGE